MAKNETTPMMVQYQKIKDQYPDAFLFYRLGDFYELFNEDAIKGSQILELTLTNRNKNAENPIPMCGVPHKAAQNYIDILVDQGYKVAICEQMEDPALTKGMVKRAVIQLITPGTQVDTGSEGAKDNNYLTAVLATDDNFQLAYVDLSTGELKVTTLANFDELTNEIINLQTKETVVLKDNSAKLSELLNKLGILASTIELKPINSTMSYLTQDIESEPQQKVLTLLISYVEETQKRSLDHLKRAVAYQPKNFLEIDHNTQYNLELIKNIRTSKKSGTLLWLLDQTKTAMGGRKLKQWIERPLMDKTVIEKRQLMVNELLDHYFERRQLQNDLVSVYDLERLAGRIAFGSVNGRDLIQLKTSLKQVPLIQHTLNSLETPHFDELNARINLMDDIVSVIEEAIVEEPPISVTDGGVIKPGFNDQLDKYRNATQNGKTWMANLEAQERELTGINNLKIGYNRIFGYYIEVTKANINKLPENRYQRKQTLTNSERFSTPELKEHEELILEAQDKSQTLEYELFTKVRDVIKNAIKRIQELADVIAEIDVLQSFASVSEEYRFVKPELTDQHEIEVINGRHPVVEKVMGHQQYVPNDIVMNQDTNILLITGPNMSGKSTFMRQLALTVIMNQIGCFVPADSAKLPVFDQIFTRIGAADDLISGESTFMVEMKEANNALQHATKNSLILFDEIGRGTATYDGMALAQAIIEFDHNNIGAKTLFSTHYHELTALDQQLQHLQNVHVGAAEQNGELVFLHKVEPGPVDKSYGIHVAKLAGLPDSLLNRANDILITLENGAKSNERTVVDENQPKISVMADDTKLNTGTTPELSNHGKDQLSLFEDDPISDVDLEIVQQVQQLDLMSKTPMQIMNQVYRWQQKLNKESGD